MESGHTHLLNEFSYDVLQKITLQPQSKYELLCTLEKELAEYQSDNRLLYIQKYIYELERRGLIENIPSGMVPHT